MYREAAGDAASESGEGGMKYAAEDKHRPLMAVELICKADGLPMPTPEYRFDHERRWRFDWAWPHRCIALEVEGAVFTNGRHTRGSGFLRDIEKYNRAAVLGWRVFRCTPQTIHVGMQMVGQALKV